MDNSLEQISQRKEPEKVVDGIIKMINEKLKLKNPQLPDKYLPSGWEKIIKLIWNENIQLDLSKKSIDNKKSKIKKRIVQLFDIKFKGKNIASEDFKVKLIEIKDKQNKNEPDFFESLKEVNKVLGNEINALDNNQQYLNHILYSLLNTYCLITINNLKHDLFEKYINLFFRFYDPQIENFQEINIKRIGKIIGDFLEKKERQLSKSDQKHIDQFWEIIVKTSSLQQDIEKKKFPISVLKSWVNQRRQDWKLDEEQTSTLYENMKAKPSTNLPAELFDLSNLLENNSTLFENKNNRDKKEIVLGRGPFHESIIFMELFQTLLQQANKSQNVSIEVNIIDTLWGQNIGSDMKAADINIQNEWAAKIKNIEDKNKVYDFQGYYGFARRNWVEEIRDNRGIDQQYKNECDRLLGNLDTSSTDKDRVNQNYLSKIRADIMLRGSPGYQSETDFKKVITSIHKTLYKKGDIKSKPTLRKGHDHNTFYDSEFIDFIAGEREVIVCGAVQAALIRRWWINKINTNPPVIQIITPDDIGNLLRQSNQSWPAMNCLCFGKNLKLEGVTIPEDADKLKEIQQQVLKVFLSLEKIIIPLLNEQKEVEKGESDDHYPMRKHLLDILARQTINIASTERNDNLKSELMFLSHEEDLCEIFIKDTILPK